MGKSCCSPNLKDTPPNESYKKVLWAALAINVVMFFVEIFGGIVVGSVSLQADAIDFLGDAGNYAISLFVLGMALKVRAKAAYFKGITMGCFGILVFASTIYHFFYGDLPEATTMGLIGFIALLSNALVLALLWKYRTGDSNMRSVWLCSRNDVIGNFAVMLAALGVFRTQSGLPDLLVALLMSLLAVQSAYLVIRDAKRELNS
jgi:cation diffusion facilitator family transporter